VLPGCLQCVHLKRIAAEKVSKQLRAAAVEHRRLRSDKKPIDARRGGSGRTDVVLRSDGVTGQNQLVGVSYLDLRRHIRLHSSTLRMQHSRRGNDRRRNRTGDELR
jgi:hypothetical protein